MTRGVAVVTGGGSGFGRAIADRGAAQGFDVALLGIDLDRASGEASAIESEHGVRVIGVGADVGDSFSVDAGIGTTGCGTGAGLPLKVVAHRWTSSDGYRLIG
jgi:NAD(P)-dependent dehydrogenase (short-subunit alcohol dehydrogenase family)